MGSLAWRMGASVGDSSWLAVAAGRWRHAAPGSNAMVVTNRVSRSLPRSCGVWVDVVAWWLGCPSGGGIGHGRNDRVGSAAWVDHGVAEKVNRRGWAYNSRLQRTASALCADRGR